RRARSSRRPRSSPDGCGTRRGSRRRCSRRRPRRSTSAAPRTRTSSSRSTGSIARSGSTSCSRRAKTDDVRVVIAGDGPDRERLERLARERGLNGRATFTGRVGDDELADLYARCLGVYYAPVDEDYGLVPYEAFLSQKPVITATDAGGPLDIVHDRETGLVVAPTADELARACSWLRDHRDEARSLGAAGRTIAQAVTWDACV